MPNEPGTITAEQALAYAARLGVTVSPTQFERWRKYGLLPRPIDRPGQGRGKGRKGHYNPGVVPLLGAISFAVKNDGRLERAAWYLWCLGLPVTRGARRAIAHYLAREEKKARRQLGPRGRNTDRQSALDPIERLEYGQLPKGLSRVRRRMGPREFVSAARLLHEMVLGDLRRAPLRNRPDFKAVAQALARLTRPEVAERDTQLPDNLATLLGQVSERANLRILRKQVAKASDWLLEAVRDQARAVWRIACALTGQPETPLPLPVFLLWVGALLTSFTLRSFIVDLELAGTEHWQALKRPPVEQWAIDRPELRPLVAALSPQPLARGAPPNEDARIE